MNKVEIMKTLKENGKKAAIFFVRTSIFMKGEGEIVGSKMNIDGREYTPSKQTDVHIDQGSSIVVTYDENPHTNESNLYIFHSKPFEGTYCFRVEEIDFFDVLNFYKFTNFDSCGLDRCSYDLVHAIAEKEIIEEKTTEGKITFSKVEFPNAPIEEVIEADDDDAYDWEDDNPLLAIEHYALTIENPGNEVLIAIDHYDYEYNTSVEFETVEGEALTLYKNAEQETIFTIENGIVTQRKCVGYACTIISDKESGEIELVLFEKAPTDQMFFKEDLDGELMLFSTQSNILDQLNIRKDSKHFV